MSVCPATARSKDARWPAAGIKGVLETSFVDWPERLCAVLFLGRCNFRCPFCHNHALVLQPEALPTIGVESILERLAPLRKWLGGICVTGGEPTLDPQLPDLLALFKVEAWPVKLDTNGSRPEVLEELLGQGLLDAVAMDVKTVLVQDKYDRCAGTAVDLQRIQRSIGLLRASGIDHEFRMTVVPGLHTEADVVAWGETLAGAGKLTLQNFNPKATLDPELAGMAAFPVTVFAGFRERVLARLKG